MNSKEILKLARELKKHFRTNNPYVIAEYYGIDILHYDTYEKAFTAHAVKIPKYPTFITVNDNYTDFSKKLLCAHELGHALLHKDYAINHFKTTKENVFSNKEREANLFAIALMADNDIDQKLTMPLASMNNYLLKTIIDYNLKFKL